MRILNAKRRTISMSLPRGKQIVIPPGEMSGSFVPTTDIVLAAVQLGTSSEIGLIYSGSYEFNVIQTVTIAPQYAYMTEVEAIDKLINKNVDYSKRQTPIEAKNVELDKANQTIKQLTKEINELKEKGSVNESDVVKELNEKVNELTGYRVKFDELTKDMKKNYVPKIEVEQAKSELDLVESENVKLKEALESAIKQIEAMKVDFNNACVKFRLAKKDAEWIQESE